MHSAHDCHTVVCGTHYNVFQPANLPCLSTARLKRRCLQLLGLRRTAPCNLVSRFCYFFSAKPRNCRQKIRFYQAKSLPFRPAFICYTTPSLPPSISFFQKTCLGLRGPQRSLRPTALRVPLTLTTC